VPAKGSSARKRLSRSPREPALREVELAKAQVDQDHACDLYLVAQHEEIEVADGPLCRAVVHGASGGRALEQRHAHPGCREARGQVRQRGLLEQRAGGCGLKRLDQRGLRIAGEARPGRTVTQPQVQEGHDSVVVERGRDGGEVVR